MRKFLLLLLTTLFFIAFIPVQIQAQMKIATAPVNKSSATSLRNVFTGYSLFSIDTKQIASQSKKSNNNIDFEIEFPGVTAMRLSLKENDILSSNYKLITGSGSSKQVSAKPNCITYAGKLTDDAASSVYLTITDHMVSGFIRGKGKEYYIEPLKNFNKEASTGVHVLYEAKDVVPHSGTACGLSTARQKLEQIQQQAITANRSTITCKKIGLALASDESMFLMYETPQNVQDHILATMNSVIGIYNNAQIGTSYFNFTINGLYVATSAAGEPFSPAYTGVEGMTILSRLSTWGEAGKFGFDYDVCQLWTRKDVQYEYQPGSFADVNGLAMNIGTICTAQKYNLIEDYNLSASYLAALSAHEIGHCMGAYHDFEFYLNYIMANISNGPTTFSPRSLTDMNNYLSQVNCLSDCSTAPIAKFSVSGGSIVNGVIQVCAGNSLSFMDNSWGEVTSTSWTFPDGSPSSSTEENPVVVFNIAGLKTIRLTVTNSYGSSTVEKTINVLPTTESTLVASATEVCRNQSYTLTYTGNDAYAALEFLNPTNNSWQFIRGLTPGEATTFNAPQPNLAFEKYRLRIDAAPCVKYSDIVRINYLSAPKPVISGNAIICPGESTVLQVTDGNPNSLPYSSILWSPGGQTSSLITVSPTLLTSYSVTVTLENGCTATVSKDVLPIQSTPVISATTSNIVCTGTSTTLSFTGTKTVTGCTNSASPYPQWPQYIVNVSACNGNYQLIADDTWAGEYSVINVEADKYYAFKMTTQDNLLLADVITISNTAGNTIYATGIGLAYWKASFTGQIRYYTHKNGCLGEQVVRKRYIACSSTASSFGSLQWMPGGQTTDAITVSPASNTVYSLTFINEFGCSATNTVNVNVGIGSLVLTTTNITCNSATLNWSSPLNPTQWELEYKSTDNGSKWINVPVANSSTRSVTVPRLKPNQSYQWHLRAKCNKSTTPYSDLVLFKTLASCIGSVTQSRSMNNAAPENEIQEIESDLRSVVMPNPSHTTFTIKVSSNDRKERIMIQVVDMAGRIIEKRSINADQQIQLGEKYRDGIYVVRILQGKQVKQLKLVKLRG